MPRQAGFAVLNDLSKGLISEASVLGFPTNGCIATTNCIHDKLGGVSRRLGFDYETNFDTKSITRDSSVIKTYLWKDVGGDGNTNIVVVQVKDTLYFYDGSNNIPLSANAFSGTVSLTDFQPSGASDPGMVECDFATGDGKLFVANPNTNPFTVEFDGSAFTATEIIIKIRDFKGQSDGLDVDKRPTATVSTMTAEHHYNLLNQGWTASSLSSWDSNNTTMPSNADVMYLFKDSSGTLTFTAAQIGKVVQGNTAAAKGHFILNAFDTDRGTQSGISGLTEDTSNGARPSCIAFFSGRVFYSGVNSPDYGSNIYFTQILNSNDQLGQCYQSNDPTSENFFDLLSTDGGVIEIQEAGTIIKMVSVPGGLIVFAANGVWVVSGSTGLGFAADDYSVVKISAVQALSASSFVDFNGTPMWWNLEGIYQLSANQGGFQVISAVEDTIKTFYNTQIPASQKFNAKGFYNAVGNLIQWLYKDTDDIDLDNHYEYNKILNLNTLTGGFYVWEIPDTDVKVHGLVVLESRGGAPFLSDVVDSSSNSVIDEDSNTVQSWQIGEGIVIPHFKYLVSKNDGLNDIFTWAETNATTYLDWDSANISSDYISSFVTGYGLGGGAIRDFQDNYIEIYTDNNSIFTIRGLWDFANSEDSKRWTNSQLINTTSKTNFSNVTSRRVIRGQGKALQIKVESLSGFPFNINGWAVFVTSNATI